MNTTEPSAVYAGDTIAWTKSLPDYPASQWTLTYALMRAGVAYTVTATANGDLHEVSVPASTSDDWTPGEYTWMATVTSGATRHTVESGAITIRANPQGASHDARSQVKRMLDAINALIEGRATSDVSSYSIGGRSLTKLSISELLTWKSKYEQWYAAEVAQNRLARGLVTGRKILTRF